MSPETIYALISDVVYSRSGPNAANNDLNLASLVPGAQRTPFFLDDRNTGLYLEVWTVGTQTIVAFRGTDFGASDFRDWTSGNVPLGTGFTSAGQLVSAIAFVDSLKAQLGAAFANVVFTGHSLGGGLAGLMAAKYGNEAYVFAPAPFKKTSDDSTFFPDGLSTANKNVLLAGPPLPPVDAGGTPLLNDPDYLQAKAIYNAALAARKALVDANYPKIHSFGLVDEVLQKFTLSGPISFATGLVGVSHFDPTPDVQFTVGGKFDFGESLAKHSMTLHALLMRTDSRTNNEGNWTDKPIGGSNGLFTKDSALRNSFLITPGVAGLLNKATTDNTSTDPNSGIMLRALISDINFYSQFYNRFGSWLSTGAVALGKSPDTPDSANELSIHSGVVKLGLQVVRDALTRTTTGPVVGDKGLNVFGAGNASGPTATYVRVDLADITATDPKLQEPGKAFGIRDITYVLATSVRDSIAFGTSDVDRQSFITKNLIGINVFEAKNGNPFPAWDTLIVQAGSNPLKYDAKATGVTADANKSHMIFGGAGNDEEVKGSTAKDYFVGGDGNDKYESGGGNDVFVGGIGEDKYIARPGAAATDGITFLGGPDKDTAVYGSDFNNIVLSINASKAANLGGLVGAKVGYGSRSDQLIGVERLEVGKGNHTATFTNEAQKYGMTVAFAGGDVTFLRIQDTLEPTPDLIAPAKGAFTRIEFTTLGATGANHQTLSTASDFEKAERPNALIFVNGRQLIGRRDIRLR